MDSPTRLVAEWVLVLSCFAIAGAFITAVLLGREPWLRRFLALLSALFLLAGANQLAPHWTSWSGSDLVERLVLPLAAAISLITAVVLLSEIGKVLALSTTRALVASNLERRGQTRERERVATELVRDGGAIHVGDGDEGGAAFPIPS